MAELLPLDADPGAPVRGRAIREIPATERPRERLAARGAAGLSSAELIGLLWGSGSRGRSAIDLAEDALARYDGLTGLARASEVELDRLAGIGTARAAQLTAAFELGRRLLADWPSGRWAIRAPADVADRLVLQMGRLEREELRVVLLNTKNVVLRVATVYQGNVAASLVRVGELFRDAVRLNAAGLILVHNHPSGDPTGHVKSVVKRIGCLVQPHFDSPFGEVGLCQTISAGHPRTTLGGSAVAFCHEPASGPCPRRRLRTRGASDGR
jgi:DNA repair protein RadC